MKAEIELTPQQWKRLNELARERSITLSQLLEAIVNQALTENALEDWEERKRRALCSSGEHLISHKITTKTERLSSISASSLSNALTADCFHRDRIPYA